MNLIEAMELMDLKPGFSQNELHCKWREMARIYHPDLNSSSTAKLQFLEIQQAYDLLKERFFGDFRGESQDCLDILSREASESQSNGSKRAHRSTRCISAPIRTLNKTAVLENRILQLLLVFVLLLAAIGIAGHSSRFHQELFELEMDMACLGSMLGAVAVAISSLVKTRVFVK